MKKKLLLLGGTSISRQIVYAAHEMDVDVYVTDYLENSPCKAIAQKSFMLSCTDVDKVVQLIKEEKIDGVLTGYADVLLPSYVKICEKAGLPCYANLRAIETTSDKCKFKNLCREGEVPVVEEYCFEQLANSNVSYPLIVKPVDNSGARGIYVCRNKADFDTYYPQAMTFSPSKHVLVERMMTHPEATIFYYLHKGEIYLMGVGDRHMYSLGEGLLRLPVGYTFPAKHQADFMKCEDENIKSLFRSLDMKEGMVFMQAFDDDGRYIIYEMGYRLTGSLEHHLFRQAYGFDTLKAIIDYAVGNKVDVTPLATMDLRSVQMANVTLLLSQGVINRYEGIEEVKRMTGVLHVHVSYGEGTEINSANLGRLSQVGIRVLLNAQSREQLLERMDAVKDKLHVISREGKDMIIRDYSYKSLCNR